MATKRAKSDIEIRLACLAAAAEHAPFRPEYVVALANDYYRFVTGKTDVEAEIMTEKLAIVRKR
jgi:hypothetical protein